MSMNVHLIYSEITTTTLRQNTIGHHQVASEGHGNIIQLQRIPQLHIQQTIVCYPSLRDRDAKATTLVNRELGKSAYVHASELWSNWYPA
jgi:hypothetical protein